MDTIDWPALRENCGGDEELVAEVLQLFVREAPGLLGDVKTAVSSNQGPAVKKTAHRLKGALMSLAAKPAVACAKELEEMGAQSRLTGLADALARLEAEMKRVVAVAQAAPKAA